jgi:hypothetical protein
MHMPVIWWGPVILAVFYAWMAVPASRMRRPGTTVPRYEPPASLSPAAARYAVRNGADGKTIAAALANLVCEGLITVTRAADGFQVSRTSAAVPSGLPQEEQVLMDLVFAYGNPNIITPADNKRMDGIVSGLEGALLKQYQGAFNTGHYNAIAVAVVMSIGWALLNAAGGRQMFMAMWGTCFTLVLFAVLLARTLPAWRDLIGGRVHDRAWFTVLFLMPLPLLMAGAAYFVMSRILPRDAVVALLAMAAINVVGGSLLRAPTPRGRKVLDEIEGYRQFLVRVEQDRLDRLTNPDDSLPLDAHVPYAIALDIKEAWGDHLCSVFVGATVSMG